MISYIFDEMEKGKFNFVENEKTQSKYDTVKLCFKEHT